MCCNNCADCYHVDYEESYDNGGNDSKLIYHSITTSVFPDTESIHFKAAKQQDLNLSSLNHLFHAFESIQHSVQQNDVCYKDQRRTSPADVVKEDRDRKDKSRGLFRTGQFYVASGTGIDQWILGSLDTARKYQYKYRSGRAAPPFIQCSFTDAAATNLFGDR